MKKAKKWATLALALALACGMSACGGNGETTETPKAEQGGQTNVTVDAIEMVSEPSKTGYNVGDSFDIAGAAIKVTYSNGETAEVSLPADGFSFTEPDMGSVGNKTVTITAENPTEGKRVRATFKVGVTEKGASITFDSNYEGGTTQTLGVSVGNAAERPAEPIREGYTFYNWFVDKTCTMPYDFSVPVSGDITLYADWKENGATYHEVTYDLNYYGLKNSTYTHIVKDKENAKPLAETPERGEFSFDGWMADNEGTIAYHSAPVTEDTIIYAGWSKSKSGESEYVFEAEHTNLDGKVGPGYSGEAVGRDMIVNDLSGTASNGAYVSYLYKQNLSLEFYIASSEDAEATLTAVLAEEFSGLDLNDESWQIRIYYGDNDSDYTQVRYGSVHLDGTSFTDAIQTKVALKKGYNCIQLITCNNANPAGENQGTYAGTAPTVDCIKLTTSAVLSWDGSKGLPVD